MPAHCAPARLARLLLAACLAFAWPCAAQETVTLQLKWSHAFQFAGYYAAKELGYYERAGLDVKIVEAGAGVDPVDEVVAGRAQYGVGSSSLLVQRSLGKPVVVLAVIFQHSPQVILGKRVSPSRGLRDLIGARVMLEPQSDELEAYLRKEGLAVGDFKAVAHTHDVRDLIEGRVEAMSAYLTVEPSQLDKVAFQYRVYSPRDAGIDFYGDNLFTSDREIRQNPRRVAAFREATLQGWNYAMNNPGEIIEIILAKYSQRLPRDFFVQEAARMSLLVTHELVEIGHMNPGRWRQIADTYAQVGMVSAGFPLEGFLYAPAPGADLRKYYGYAGAAAALMALIVALAFYVHRTNVRLRRALEDSRAAQDALRASDQRQRLLAEHASDVIWTRDLAGNFTYVSPAVRTLRGYTVDEVMTQSVDDSYAPESAALMHEYLHRLLEAANAGAHDAEFRGEFELRRKDGSTVWVETTITDLRDSEGNLAGVVGVTRDISERKRNEARMRELALHDALTGLPNRTLFSDRLRQALAAAQRERRRLAVMFIDLDKFKPINDEHGHAVGDELLKEVAKRMHACVRESDTVARIGGDEFVVLLRSVEGGPLAVGVGEKIRHSLNEPFEVLGLRLEISCCIGVALYPEHGADEIELSKNADAAMYWAKAHGRDNVQLYRSEMARDI